jgi:hypothetical protein
MVSSGADDPTSAGYDRNLFTGKVTVDVMGADFGCTGLLL